MSRVMNKYKSSRISAAFRDQRARPALTYYANMSPQDVGLPDEYACIIW